MFDSWRGEANPYRFLQMVLWVRGPPKRSGLDLPLRLLPSSAIKRLAQPFLGKLSEDILLRQLHTVDYV